MSEIKKARFDNLAFFLLFGDHYHNYPQERHYDPPNNQAGDPLAVVLQTFNSLTQLIDLANQSGSSPLPRMVVSWSSIVPIEFVPP